MEATLPSLAPPYPSYFDVFIAAHTCTHLHLCECGVLHMSISHPASDHSQYAYKKQPALHWEGTFHK
ncbi:hypothetical protein GQ54DRAFT_296952 [Martensiomyces pterosporus]|nr:hypothetical protein GQ54DRAFT_296952 [Martensiomyces pterosporus]